MSKERVLFYTGESTRQRGALQVTGKALYADGNLGYIADKVVLKWHHPDTGYLFPLDKYPSAMPYVSCVFSAKNLHYQPPALQYKGDGGLVVAGAVVWAMPYGYFSDDAYCKTLLPCKDQIKAALEKACET